MGGRSKAALPWLPGALWCSSESILTLKRYELWCENARLEANDVRLQPHEFWRAGSQPPHWLPSDRFCGLAWLILLKRLKHPDETLGIVPLKHVKIPTLVRPCGEETKRHLADPSLSAAALCVEVSELMGDLNTFGFLFEVLYERGLAVYSPSLGGNLLHYRDSEARDRRGGRVFRDSVGSLQDQAWNEPGEGGGGRFIRTYDVP